MADLSASWTPPETYECDLCIQTSHSSTVFPPVTSTCQHPPAVCYQCIRKWAETIIEDQDRQCITATCAICPERMRDTDFRTHCSPETFVRYSEKAFLEYLAQDPNFVHCPMPDCPSGQLHDRTGTDKPEMFHCVACSGVTCLHHQIPWHHGRTCNEYDDEVRGDPERRQGENELSETFLQESDKHKQCPRCNAWIQKSGGCEHMSCRNGACRMEFCWTCRGEWPLGHTEDCALYIRPAAEVIFGPVAHGALMNNAAAELNATRVAIARNMRENRAIHQRAQEREARFYRPNERPAAEHGPQERAPADAALPDPYAEPEARRRQFHARRRPRQLDELTANPPRSQPGDPEMPDLHHGRGVVGRMTRDFRQREGMRLEIQRRQRERSGAAVMVEHVQPAEQERRQREAMRLEAQFQQEQEHRHEEAMRLRVQRQRDQERRLEEAVRLQAQIQQAMRLRAQIQRDRLDAAGEVDRAQRANFLEEERRHEDEIRLQVQRQRERLEEQVVHVNR